MYVCIPVAIVRPRLCKWRAEKDTFATYSLIVLLLAVYITHVYVTVVKGVSVLRKTPFSCGCYYNDVSAFKAYRVDS